MSVLPRRVLWYGKDAPLPEARELRAGPLTMLLEEGGLRYVRLGGVEILRQVYGAVRDRNWNTVPAEISNLRVEQGESSFEVSFDVRCRQGDVDFAWTGTITGAADGTVVFRFDGEARSTFLRNRIGICVLHPILECAGRPCRVTHTAGAVEEGVFPRLISPHQPFKDLAAIAHPVAAGCEAEVRFEGEVFEMEDQRNWTDASFKTYSTPLALPFPVEIKAGTRITQTVTLALKGRVPKLAVPSAEPTLTVGKQTHGEPFLPDIGFGAAGVELSGRQTARLQALRPGHLRVDLDLREGRWESPLKAAAREARALETRLFIAYRNGTEAGLGAVVDRLASLGARPSALVALDPATEEELIPARLACHRANTEYGWLYIKDEAGTAAYFAEFNRARLRGPAGLRLCMYSVNPQVHGSDLRTLVETLAGQAETLLSGGTCIVSPITLKPRFNPNATAAERDVEEALPPSVDERQMSLFGAAWTLGSLKRLAEQRPAALTYYETVGWRGLMEAETGSPQPERFRSLPGAVFPLYHVFADLAPFAGGRTLSSGSSLPLRAEIFAFKHEDRFRALVANFTAEPLRVRLAGLPDRLLVRRLNETNAERAMTSPEEYRAEPPEIFVGGALDLMPFEIVRIDV